MGKTAFIFPGQGSQFVGMGLDFYENYSVAKNIYDSADEILNREISKICFYGPEDELKQTINTQPTIVTTSIAILEVLKSEFSITPDYVAGHSLGEYCAMYEAGALDLKTTLQLIQKRADLMSKCKDGGMAAVIGASEETLNEAIKQASAAGYIDIANYNSPVQTVLTGDKNAIEKAGIILKDLGIKRYIELPVSGAFHSKYMTDAANNFAEFLQNFKIYNAKIPVVTNVDAKETTKAEEFIDKMPRQICSSVYWTQSIQNMISKGVSTFIEIGPGKILTGLNKKIDSSIVTYSISNKDSLEEVINLMRG